MVAASPISSMSPEREYFAVPWVMSIDQRGRCHISSCTHLQDHQVGSNFQLRLSRRSDGLHAHIDRSAMESFRWSPEVNDGSAWFAIGVDVLWVDGVRQLQPVLPVDLHEFRAAAAA